MTWAKIELPFSGGLDEKSRIWATPNGSFQELVNVVQTRDGGAYEKRNGFAAMATDTVDERLPNVTDPFDVPKRIFAHRDSPCIIDKNSNLYAYGASLQAWRCVDRVPACTVTALPTLGNVGELGPSNTLFVGGTASAFKFADVAYCNGYIVSVISCTGAFVVRVMDAASGNQVFQAVEDTLGGSNKYFVKCVTVGTVVYFVVWGSTDKNNLYWTGLDCANFVTVSAGLSALAALANVSGDLGLSNRGTNTGTPAFDVWAGPTKIYVAYISKDSPPSILHTRSYNPASAMAQVASSAEGWASSNYVPKTIAVHGSESNTIWVACDTGILVTSEATHIQALGLNPSTLATTVTLGTVYNLDVDGTPTSRGCASIGVLWTSNNVGHVLTQDDAGTMQWSAFHVSAGAAAPVYSQPTYAYNTMPISKAFQYGGRVYAHVKPSFSDGEDEISTSAFSMRPVQSKSLVIDVTGKTAASASIDVVGRPVGVLAPGLCDHADLTTLRTAGIGLMNWAQISATKWATSTLVRTSGNGLAQGGVSSLDAFILDFADGSNQLAASIPGGTVLGGGCVHVYDGMGVGESGFSTYPIVINVVEQTGGALTSGTTYQYTAIYEYVDDAGRTHRSAPSVGIGDDPTVVAQFAANSTYQSAWIYLTAEQYSNRFRFQATSGAKVKTMTVAVYRRPAGGVFQRIGTMEMDAGVRILVFKDNVSDGDADEGEALYTEAGALPRFQPDAMRVVITHIDRLFGIDSYRQNVWYSGQFVYGESPWWSNDFQFPVPARGPLTALASMEGRVYVFSQDQIFFVEGDGPADNGNGQFSLPAEIPTGGIGCIEPRSVVVTQAGIFFQSAQGIYLLSRSHEVAFIGRNVEQTTLGKSQTPWPVITGAVVDNGHGRVYFTMTSADGSQGGRAVYDYVHNVWTIDKIAAGGTLGSAIVAVPAGAVMVGGTMPGASGQLMYLAVNGGGAAYVLQETPGAYLDGGVPMTLKLSTGWIRMDGEQGYTRIRDITLLAERKSSHSLTMGVSYDYDSSDGAVSYDETHTWAAATIDALVPQIREQLRATLGQQKVQAVRVEIFDTPADSYGTDQGCVVYGLAMRARAKGGVARISENQAQ